MVICYFFKNAMFRDIFSEKFLGLFKQQYQYGKKEIKFGSSVFSGKDKIRYEFESKQ